MAVTRQDVKRVAKLAKLDLSESQEKEMESQLSRIFEWVEKLNEPKTANIEPLVSVSVDSMPIDQDEVREGDQAEAIVANAPESTLNMFVVPKIVE